MITTTKKIVEQIFKTGQWNDQSHMAASPGSVSDNAGQDCACHNNIRSLNGYLHLTLNKVWGFLFAAHKDPNFIIPCVEGSLQD